MRAIGQVADLHAGQTDPIALVRRRLIVKFHSSAISRVSSPTSRAL